MRRLTMQTPSNEKRCSNYAAKDYEKQIAILRRKLEDAETERANETKMRRHYEHLVNDTKSDRSLQTHVAKTLARIDVDEDQLAQAKVAADGYVAQLATATAQLDAFKKDSGDHVKQLTEQLNNLHAEVARNDKKLSEAIAAGEEYAAQLARANRELKDKCDEVDNLQRKLEDLNNVEDGAGNEDASPPATPSVLHPIDLGSSAANVAYAQKCKEVDMLQAELSAAHAAIDATGLITTPRATRSLRGKAKRPDLIKKVVELANKLKKQTEEHDKVA